MKILRNLLTIIMLTFISCTPAYASDSSVFLIPSFIETELAKFRTLTELPKAQTKEKQLFVIEVTWNFLTEQEVFYVLKEQVINKHETMLKSGRIYGVLIINGPTITEVKSGEYVYKIVFGIIELGQEV